MDEQIDKIRAQILLATVNEATGGKNYGISTDNPLWKQGAEACKAIREMFPGITRREIRAMLDNYRNN
jgi:hypothetical protein